MATEISTALRFLRLTFTGDRVNPTAHIDIQTTITGLPSGEQSSLASIEMVVTTDVPDLLGIGLTEVQAAGIASILAHVRENFPIWAPDE